jgi:hypothetical protein
VEIEDTDLQCWFTLPSWLRDQLDRYDDFGDEFEPYSFELDLHPAVRANYLSPDPQKAIRSRYSDGLSRYRWPNLQPYSKSNGSANDHSCKGPHTRRLKSSRSSEA